MCHQGGLGTPQLTMHRLENLNAKSSEMAGSPEKWQSQSIDSNGAQNKEGPTGGVILNRGSEFGKIESGTFILPRDSDYNQE